MNTTATTKPDKGHRSTRTRPALRSDHPQVHEVLIGLGERIRRARVARDIPLSDLAKRVGVTTATLSRLERGAPGVSMETLSLALWHMNLLEQLSKVCAAGSDPEGDRLEMMRQPSKARGHRLGDNGSWASLHGL